MSELHKEQAGRRTPQTPQSAKLLRDLRRLDAQRKRHVVEVAAAVSQASLGTPLSPPLRGQIMALLDDTGTLLADLEVARDAVARALQSYHRHAAAAQAYAALARK